jgi:methylthioribose-1-phosphate isomerase
VFLPIEWLPEGRVRYLDQTRLPHDEVWKETADPSVIAEAIRRLEVRGAPLIGIAAAYGLAAAAISISERDTARFRTELERAAAELLATRPTAVNLAWAIARCLKAIESVEELDEIRRILVHEARLIHEEDVAGNQRMGELGASLLPVGARVLTHCNAGSLATGGYGTALGVVRAARDHGKISHVYNTETRPLLQGARLTAWELSSESIPFTLIIDSAAGSLMRRHMVDAVITGADRIAANGDVANKIGTYQVAVLANVNEVPFYVAAPISTIDLSLAGGDDIPIEERAPDEVTSIRGHATTPEGTAAANPAFDVTPNRFVTAIVTENGIAKAPYDAGLRQVCALGVPAHG